jgi:hypothetical protein
MDEGRGASTLRGLDSGDHHAWWLCKLVRSGPVHSKWRQNTLF